jgi:hypothetical protein
MIKRCMFHHLCRCRNVTFTTQSTNTIQLNTPPSQCNMLLSTKEPSLGQGRSSTQVKTKVFKLSLGRNSLPISLQNPYPSKTENRLKIWLAHTIRSQVTRPLLRKRSLTAPESLFLTRQSAGSSATFQTLIPDTSRRV